MLFLVLKMTFNSEESSPVVIWSNAFMPAVGNPDGFKELRDFGLNAIGDYLGWALLLFIPPWAYQCLR